MCTVVCEEAATCLPADVQGAVTVVGQTANAHLDAVKKAEAALLVALSQLAAERRALQDEQLSWVADVAAYREALARERAAFEEERNGMRHIRDQQRGAMLLDVGGTEYRTSRSTLTSVPGSMLEAMFSGRNDDLLEQDSQGRTFVDRDGAIFRHILNFLRDRSAREDLAGLSEKELRGVQREARYFGLEEAMFPPAPPSVAVGPSSLLVAGGYGGNCHHDSTEFLDLATMALVPGPQLSSRRNGFAAAPLDERRLLTVGGNDGTRGLETTEVLDLEDMVFRPGPELGTPRFGCATVQLDAGRLLVAGGSDGSCRLDTTEVLDLSTMTFSPGPRMCMRRNGCALARMDKTRFIVVGGFDGKHRLDTSEILDTKTMSFAAGPRMGTCRSHCAAVMLDEGRLLVTGGYDGVSWLSSSEILDVEKMRFSPGPPLLTPRWCLSAALLGMDRVLVAGGNDGTSGLDSTEILSLKSMSFSPGPLLSVQRDGCTALSW